MTPPTETGKEGFAYSYNKAAAAATHVYDDTLRSCSPHSVNTAERLASLTVGCMPCHLCTTYYKTTSFIILFQVSLLPFVRCLEGSEEKEKQRKSPLAARARNQFLTCEARRCVVVPPTKTSLSPPIALSRVAMLCVVRSFTLFPPRRSRQMKKCRSYISIVVAEARVEIERVGKRREEENGDIHTKSKYCRRYKRGWTYQLFYCM